MAAWPRPCYPAIGGAALASAKMCFASFCLPSPSLDTEPKEARPQGLIRFFHQSLLYYHLKSLTR